MTTLRLELEISAVDPSGDMVFVEARGPGGVQIGLMLPPGMLTARTGQRVTVALDTPAQVTSSMRERMAKPGVAAATTPPTTTGMTDVVLSAILGGSSSVERERDVEDEMDALLGRRQGR